MKHCTEDDLILYYYEERPRAAAVSRNITRHLDACTECADAYHALSATLKMLATPEAPERGEQYGLEVWQRIRHQLPEQEQPWWSAWFRTDRLALASAFAVMLVAAFVAGRWWSAGNAQAPLATASVAPAAAPKSALASDDDNRQRILLTSVTDHLDRSERVLTEIMNTPAGSDISTEQRWAEDLINASRLYRQDAADTGEQSVALVLEELERSLLEIVHTPSRATAARLDEIRRRIDAASLVFKVRVLGNELRQRDERPDHGPRALTTHTS